MIQDRSGDERTPRARHDALVSIGLPVHNGGSRLAGAIDSLLAQSYRNIELIVSENASSDGTTELARRYAQRDPRVRVIESNELLPIVPNFQRALAAASGEYFMWAAADDLWEPGFVAALVDKLESDAEMGVAMTAVRRVWADDAVLDIVRFDGALDPTGMSHLETVRALTTPAKYNYFIYGLFVRDLLTRAAMVFPEVPGEDRILMIQVALSARLGYVDEPLQTKTLYRESYEERRPAEERSRMILDRLVGLRMAGALVRSVLMSRVVPTRRKLWAPLILFWYVRLLRAPYRQPLRVRVRRHVPEALVRVVRAARAARYSRRRKDGC